MIAVDTNILLRWITRDDPAQANVAADLMQGEVAISLTVLIELVWVLSSAHYGFDRRMVAETMRVLLATRTISIEAEAGVAWATERFAAGGDFADMIHLVAAQAGTTGFATFDRRLAAGAGNDPPVPVATYG